MRVKLRGRKGTYTAIQAVIHSCSTDVFISELNTYVNSAEIISKEFDVEFEEALDYFEECPEAVCDGIFIKDY